MTKRRSLSRAESGYPPGVHFLDGSRDLCLPRIRKRSEWSSLRLDDADVSRLVNVKFLAAHHGYSPDDIIRLHQNGGGFAKLHGTVKQHKRSAKRQRAGESKGHGKMERRRRNEGSKASGHSGSGGGHGSAKGKGGKGGQRGKKH